MNAIGNKIKLLRKSKRMSRQSLADRLGVSTTIVHNWETGLTDIRLAGLIKMAEILDTTILELLGLEGELIDHQYARQIEELNQKIIELNEYVDLLQKKILIEYDKMNLL